jgi:N-glycosylase/DNA lyase
MAVFNDPLPGKTPKIRLRYGTANRARKTIKKLKKQPLSYQLQGAHTMYYRAKYHKHQTKGMKDAMKIYKKFLNTHKKHKHKKIERSM